MGQSGEKRAAKERRAKCGGGVGFTASQRGPDVAMVEQHEIDATPAR